MSVSEAWQIIENWYAESASTLEPGLRGGATAQELRHAQDVLGIEFPSDVKQSYEMHNGSKNAVFPNGYYLLSLTEVIDEREVWCSLLAAGELPKSLPDVIGPAKQIWWSEKWIPITHSGGGDHDCVDLDPPSNGTAGQIIQFDHERGPRRVVSS